MKFILKNEFSRANLCENTSFHLGLLSNQIDISNPGKEKGTSQLTFLAQLLRLVPKFSWRICPQTFAFGQLLSFVA